MSPAPKTYNMSAPPRLVKELSFYRRYHRNAVNVAIHVVCIPLILLSSAYILSSYTLPSHLAEQLGISESSAKYYNLATVLGIYFAATYTRLDPIYGVPYGSGLIWACARFTEKQQVYGKSGTNIAWCLWVVCWLLQFVGHGFFEGKAPALLDNLHQALVLAPFFAAFEVSHIFGLRTDVLDSVDEYLSAVEKKKST